MQSGGSVGFSRSLARGVGLKICRVCESLRGVYMCFFLREHGCEFLFKAVVFV